MPAIQVSTKEELNKAVYELAVLIQKLAKEGTGLSISQLPSVVQSASELVDKARPYLD